MKISIIGYGHVGKAMHKVFTKATIYDPNITKYTNKKQVMGSQVAFVCVPTPMKETGECDTSYVESVLEWLDANVIVLRSTVYVGFTTYAMQKYQKRIVFQPEYYGETIDHPFANLKNQKWLSFGGKQEDIDIVIGAYKGATNSNVLIMQDNPENVEMAKYMENSFLALKVTFCNEMFDIAKSLGVNYNRAREIWLADPRIGRSHTFVYENKRGYAGKCLPKDIASITYQAKKNGVDNLLLKTIIKKNKQYN